MIVPRCCARCHVVVSDRQRCPCIVCGACTTDGGQPGPGCACTRPVAVSSQRRESWNNDSDPVTDIERGIELARAGHG